MISALIFIIGLIAGVLLLRGYLRHECDILDEQAITTDNPALGWAVVFMRKLLRD